VRSPADVLDDLANALTELAHAERELGAAEERRDALERRVAALRAEREGLQLRNDSGITIDVTKAQSRRRGRAIAKGKAAERTDGAAIAQAIAKDSRWGSLTKYAKARLRISQPALSRYLGGGLDVPPEVIAAVQADFGLGAEHWPKRRR